MDVYNYETDDTFDEVSCQGYFDGGPVDLKEGDYIHIYDNQRNWLGMIIYEVAVIPE